MLQQKIRGEQRTNQPPLTLVIARLALSALLVFASFGCADRASDPRVIDPAHLQFIEESSFPPEPQAGDQIRKEKADVIVLPTVSLSVWAIGAIAAYISGVVVYYSSSEDFAYLWNETFGARSDPWEELDRAAQEVESHAQAEHVSTSLEQVIYRSETSDFYALTGNDYLHFMNATAQISYLDPKTLRDLLDGKVRPLAGYAKTYLDQIRQLSMEGRYESASDGFCIRAEISRVDNPAVTYMASARAHGATDVIPAAILASLKATIQCGTYDPKIMDFVYGYYEVNGPLGSITDVFISHLFRSVKLLYKYVDTCQLPPKLTMTLNEGSCGVETP
ncbi:MAG: hypothetical protein VYD19_07020 [Myxococcota bacterium]|nr:hypothetical protein [Myxococcota bacterium]